MHTKDRNGFCKIQFSGVYSIQVYVSETFEDPNPSNCTWKMTTFDKVMILNPLEQKINKYRRKESEKINKLNENIYFRFVANSNYENEL